jgi:hypothetical protein
MRDLQSYIDEEYRNAPEKAMRLYDGKTIDDAERSAASGFAFGLCRDKLSSDQ